MASQTDGIGVVDIAEANPESRKGVQDLVRDPTRMADFHYQRILLESRLQLPKVFPVLRFVLEGPRKLDQDRPQSICFRNGINAGFEIALVLRRRLPLMRERVEELGRKAKASIVTDASYFPT